MRYALLADNDVLKVGRYRIRVHSRLASRVQGRLDSAGSRPIAVPSRNLRGEIRWNPFSPMETRGSPGLGNSGRLPGRDRAWRHSCCSIPGSHRPSNGLPATNGPIRLEKGDISESVLVPLVNQFGMMQQQMLDQFQQAIATLVQMFGNLHRDQMTTIRDEFDQLRELTREFQALKLELAVRFAVLSRTGHGNADSRRALRPHPSRRRGLEGCSEPRTNPSQETGGAADPVADQIGPASGLVPPVLAPSSVLPLPRQFPRLVGPGPSHGVPLPGAPLDTPAQNSLIADRPRRRPGGSNLESDRDVIIWLHQRMMTLQQERETRWQKILKLLPGLS